MNQTIYLFRHGETQYNTQGRYQGELDSTLTEDGINQVKMNARILKSLIKDPNEWEIISSPLGRAVESTKIICETIGYEFSKVKIDIRLSEVAVGSWAGLTLEQIEVGWKNNMENTNLYNWYFNSPDGESYDTVVKRLSSWFKDIENLPNVIVVSHGLTGRVLRGVYSNLSKEEALKLEVSQRTFFKLSEQNVHKISSDFDDF
ncbi:histidine phosphatase family protein [Psychrobacillus sp. FSL K6-2843]|uniref:histidine phosphatase family protein n=1 Tax=Psychrobacillus sp. FSL K6-2843 TaxID=2921549 RepID=UPI00315B3C55